MFYTTGISVTLWILNNNKKERTVKLPDATRNYRDRENEILFMDLREIGVPFEKKFIQFSADNIQKITETYHNWQQKEAGYKDIPEFCKSATIEDIKKRDFSLVPSKYIEFVNRDENINFEEKMQTLQTEIAGLLKQEAESKEDLLAVFKDLGYEL
jgi:type I restriction enzyme M protein